MFPIDIYIYIYKYIKELKKVKLHDLSLHVEIYFSFYIYFSCSV